MVFFILRSIFIFSIVVALNQFPIVQCVSLVIVNILILVFLIRERPFRNQINVYQLTSFEIIIFLINAFVVSIAFLDGDSEDKQKLGTAVIGMNIALYALNFVFLIIKFV